VRSAFGIAQDDCFPHDSDAGPRVEEDVKTVDGEEAWGANCHHPEHVGLVDEGYLHAYALDGTGHDFTVQGNVKPGSDGVFEVVADYVEFQLTAAPDVDGDTFADDWQRYFLTPPDNCRLTPNPSQADTNANGFGDADYDGDGIPDFMLFFPVYGALESDENCSAAGSRRLRRREPALKLGARRPIHESGPGPTLARVRRNSYTLSIWSDHPVWQRRTTGPTPRSRRKHLF
jgi:hypothetical protein